VAYLAGHNRPVHEVLFPKAKPLEPAFTNEFSGMTRNVIEVDALAHVQARLLDELPRQLTAAHREFLLTMVQGSPAWERMPMQHLHDLPALKWKLMNLAQLRKRSAARFEAQHLLLAERFDAMTRSCETSGRAAVQSSTSLRRQPTARTDSWTGDGN
jgi:hypothetical protein